MVSSFMHHIYSFTRQEDPEEWLDDFYTTAVNASLNQKC